MEPRTGTWNVAVGASGHASALIYSSESARPVMVTIRKRRQSQLPVVVQVNGVRGPRATLSCAEDAKTFVLPAVTTLHVAAAPPRDGVCASAAGDYAITLLETPLARS